MVEGFGRREVHPRRSQNMKDRRARVGGGDHGQARWMKMKRYLKRMEDVNWIQLSRGGVQWQWKPVIKFNKNFHDRMSESKILNDSDLRIILNLFCL